MATPPPAAPPPAAPPSPPPSRSDARPHFFLTAAGTPHPCSAKGGGPEQPPVSPPADPASHADRLIRQLEALRQQPRSGDGQCVLVRSRPGQPLKTDSLNASGLELKAILPPRAGLSLAAAGGTAASAPGEIQQAVIFVTPPAWGKLEKKITDWYNNSKNAKNRPNDRLVAPLDTLERPGCARDLWAGEDDQFPSDVNSCRKWEVWLRPLQSLEHPANSTAKETGQRQARDTFFQAVRKTGAAADQEILALPEADVIQVQATVRQMDGIVTGSDSVFCLNTVAVTAEFFDSMKVTVQKEWIDDLCSRLRPADEAGVRLCLLDTGIDRSHPLLAPFIDARASHNATRDNISDPADTADSLPPAEPEEACHGTLMAGLAVLGDLTPLLENQAIIDVPWRLESARIQARKYSPHDNKLRIAESEEHLAVCCRRAVYLTEQGFATSRRIWYMATSQSGPRHEGLPSILAATLDQLAAGGSSQPLPAQTQLPQTLATQTLPPKTLATRTRATTPLLTAPGFSQNPPRLFCVATGNLREAPDSPLGTALRSSHYPSLNDRSEIESPSQAWNVLTVGACTELLAVSGDNPQRLKPVAPAGDISPTARTASWQKTWPVKPELVMEGGNRAVGELDPWDMSMSTADLSLLTTTVTSRGRLLEPAGDSSAATAQVAGMAASLAARFPDLWPETLRALLVNSARWTRQMQSHLKQTHSKNDVAELLCRYGYGIPSLERASASAAGRASLVIEDTIVPYPLAEAGEKATSYQLKLFSLPWPRQTLQALDCKVRLYVTLSWFVQPRPKANSRMPGNYASHRLGFALKTVEESEEAFLRRVSKPKGSARSGESDADNWKIGPKRRGSAGSLHSDIWTGPASDLARQDALAVFSANGWWKDLPRNQGKGHETRFSLVVTIDAGDVDIYSEIQTEILNRVQATARVPVEVETSASPSGSPFRRP